MIEVARVLGWNCVVKKGELAVGDLCLYVEIDSQLSPVGPFEFLDGRNVRTSVEGRRDPVLQTMRLRGVMSQGLAIPVPFELEGLPEDTDVTEQLGITKWEAPIPADMDGEARCAFPSRVGKSDEDRMQLFPDILDDYPDIAFVATQKYDGTSMTVFNDDGDFHVCSRNWSMLDTDTTMWKLFRWYEMAKFLKPGEFLQAEVFGPGLQKNPHKLTQPDIRVFNYGHVETGYVPYDTMRAKLTAAGIPVVAEVARFHGREHTLESLIELADSTKLEGIVIRPAFQELRDVRTGRLSFKVISPKYLVKHKDTQ